MKIRYRIVVLTSHKFLNRFIFSFQCVHVLWELLLLNINYLVLKTYYCFIHSFIHSFIHLQPNFTKFAPRLLTVRCFRYERSVERERRRGASPVLSNDSEVVVGTGAQTLHCERRLGGVHVTDHFPRLTGHLAFLNAVAGDGPRVHALRCPPGQRYRVVAECVDCQWSDRCYWLTWTYRRKQYMCHVRHISNYRNTSYNNNNNNNNNRIIIMDWL